MKAYSMDLRERIVSARRNGESVKSVSERFGVCSKTVRVYEKRAAQGRLRPTPRVGKARRLSVGEHEALGAVVKERSDWTLLTLSEEWHTRSGQSVPPTTLRDALHRLKMTHKKSLVSPVNAARSNEKPLV